MSGGVAQAFALAGITNTMVCPVLRVLGEGQGALSGNGRKNR